MVLASDIIYYLDTKFDAAIGKAVVIFKSRGLLINSDLDLEGAIYKSRFFKTLDDVIENYRLGM